MPLPAPDYTDCREKRRCLGGKNDGFVYTVAAPCEALGAGITFDEAACDCDLPDVARSSWTADRIFTVNLGFCTDQNNPETSGCTSLDGAVAGSDTPSYLTLPGTTPHQLVYLDQNGDYFEEPVCVIPSGSSCAFAYAKVEWRVLDSAGNNILADAGGNVITASISEIDGYACWVTSGITSLCTPRVSFGGYTT